MKITTLILSLVLGISTMLTGAEAAGSVEAVKGLQMNGQTVPVEGTKSWPVAAGDELKSEGAPVVLTMRDGSRIVLGKNSRAKVEAGTVRLVSGTMRYDVAANSALRVAVKDEVMTARTGVVSTVGNAAAPAVASQQAAAEALPPVSRRKP
jgi:hypothetical protein